MKGNFARIIIGDSRSLVELGDETIHLTVTSPPYWHIKDYNTEGQIGYNQTLHEYLIDLFRVWKEVYRVLRPGSRLCINVGDQFLRTVTYGRYRIVPLHSEFINQCEQIGFDYLGSIIWQKKTTMNTTGGASVMGSFPYPKNGIIEVDYEYILVFKKIGKTGVDRAVKEKSRLSKKEWKEYFSSHWNFGGERQVDHEAMFPDELPKRLIKMFSFVGDTVLDPFLGSGTTIKAALENDRNAVGYELNEKYLKTIERKAGLAGSLQEYTFDFEIMRRTGRPENEKLEYHPAIKDAKPVVDPWGKTPGKNTSMNKVVDILDGSTLKLENGMIIKLHGIEIVDEKASMIYLNDFVKGKKVFLKYGNDEIPSPGITPAYVFLKNKIFINKELVRKKIALLGNYSFPYRKTLEKVASTT
jgi:DNA modification methylase